MQKKMEREKLQIAFKLENMKTTTGRPFDKKK